MKFHLKRHPNIQLTRFSKKCQLTGFSSKPLKWQKFLPLVTLTNPCKHHFTLKIWISQDHFNFKKCKFCPLVVQVLSLLLFPLLSHFLIIFAIVCNYQVDHVIFQPTLIHTLESSKPRDLCHWIQFTSNIFENRYRDYGRHTKLECARDDRRVNIRDIDERQVRLLGSLIVY